MTKKVKTLQFPVVKRVFASLITNQIVGVQPMSMPSSLVFYTEYQYGDKLKYEQKRIDALIKSIEDFSVDE